MTDIERIPVTEPLPFEAIPREWQSLMRKIYDVEPSVKGKHRIVRDFLEAEMAYKTKNLHPTMTEKTYYGGPLQVSRILDRMGQSNPSPLPAHIVEDMRTHPQIALSSGIVKGIIRGLDWSIECKDERQKLFLEDTISHIYTDLIDGMTNALDFGFQSFELVWDLDRITIADMEGNPPRRRVYYDDVAFYIKKVKDHYPGSIRIVTDDLGNFQGIIQRRAADGRYIRLKPGYKLMLFGFNQDFGNWFGQSRMKSCYNHWFWYNFIFHCMTRWSERRATPQLIGRHPEGYRRKADGTKQEAADFTVEMLMGLFEHAFAVFPAEYDSSSGKPLWDVSLLGDDPSRATMWTDLLNYIDTQIIRGYCLPDRAVAQDLSPGGTSAGTESSRDLMLIVVADPIQKIARGINRDIIPALYRENFLAHNRIRAKFKFHRPEFDRRALSKEILVEWIRQWPNFIKAGMIPNKVPALAELCGILDVPYEVVSAIFDDSYTQVTEEYKNQAKPQEPPVTEEIVVKRETETGDEEKEEE